MRRALIAASVVLVTAGCGGSQLGLTEYVEQMNAIVANSRAQAEAEYRRYQAIPEPSLESVRKLLEHVLLIRKEAQDALGALEAPALVAELHGTMVKWHADLIEAEAALSVRAGEASSWSELEHSPESRALDALLAEGLVTCRELQAELDATAFRSAFADTPWIPSSLIEVVVAVLGCDTPLLE